MRAEMGQQQVLARPTGRARCSGRAGPPPRSRCRRASRRAAGSRGLSGLPSSVIVPPLRGPQAEDRLDRLRPPGADEAAEAEDFAAADREGHVAHQRAARAGRSTSRATGRRSRAPLRPARGIDARRGPARPCGGSVRPGVSDPVVDARPATVRPSRMIGDAVGDREDFLQPVGDEDQRRGRRPRSRAMMSNRRSTSVGLSEAVGSSKMMSSASSAERLGDLDELALGRRTGAGPLDVERQDVLLAERRQQLARPAPVQRRQGEAGPGGRVRAGRCSPAPTGRGRGSSPASRWRCRASSASRVERRPSGWPAIDDLARVAG